MQAKETKFQDIIEGTKQYIIPLFQRTYSWDKKEWEILWKDLKELCEAEKPRTHFIGSIVNMPTISVPEGVAKYLLIDGQQRLTTIFIILALLRNRARENGQKNFAEEINNTLLVNPYKKELDFFKLMPTQVDREAYKNLINDKPQNDENQIIKAYSFYEKKLRQNSLDNEVLKKIITNYFSVVSIVLDVDDNPYLVFESLNAKGRPLSQADLIRNYFFMRIHVDQQDSVYHELWMPMQDALKDNLTEYIRHYLMRQGSSVKQGDVYYSLKENVNQNNAIEYLRELSKYSNYYQKLLDPEFEPDLDIRKYLRRLNRIEVTTAYPLLLTFYNYYIERKINKDNYIEILKTIENYLIRRYICSVPTNSLNKIFPTIIPQLISKHADNLPEGLRILLQSKGYPKDAEFKLRFKEIKLYGAGDRAIKTKLILESLEDFHEHKEPVPFDNLTIEHIMPQTLSEIWQKNLGDGWEVTHELYLHCIGNLTLTAYNAELSNGDFSAKKELLKNSHVELNKYFNSIENWNKEEIEKRTEFLTNIAIKIWSYFGQISSEQSQKQDVTGTTPKGLHIFGQSFEVKSWRDVLENTLNTISDLEPDKFEMLIQQFPTFIGKDKNKFRSIRELKNGTFIEVNLSAHSIQKLCYQVMETLELTSEEWKVETV